MNEKALAFRARTKKFALDVIDFVETLPERGPAARIAGQLVDSATSTAANYRSACRARSRAEFAAKLGVALEECDESVFWLELADEKSWGALKARKSLLEEGNELTAILVASSITARQPRRE
jgi:four helix bundle protein